MDEKQIKSKISEGYIFTRIILEVVGTPKKYVEDSLKDYLKKIKQDKNIILVKEHTEKAVPHGEEGKLFSAFSEMEILLKDTYALLSFCFDYMPASIEIIEPEKIFIKNNDFAGFVNDLLVRLHSLNNSVITLQDSNVFYLKNLAVLMRNFIVVMLSNNPMSLEEMVPLMGVRKEDIEKVMNVLINEGKVKKVGEIYSVVPKNGTKK